MRIQLLGNPGIFDQEGRRIRLKYAKSRALIFMLAAEREPLNVTTAQTRLWGGVEESSDLDSKWNAVIGDVEGKLAGAIGTDGKHVWLQDAWHDASDWSHILNWVQARVQDPDTQPPDVTWGSFLDGFDAVATAEFKVWRNAFNERVRNLSTDALEAHARHRILKGDDAGALEALRAALNLSPWVEQLHQETIETLGRLGRSEDAHAQYRVCETALQQHFGHGPSERTRTARRNAAEREGPLATTREHRAQIPNPVLPPIGRNALVQRTVQLLRDEATRALHLVGPPGVGTTTVASEAARQVEQEGAGVHWTEWRYADSELAGWNAARTRLSGLESPVSTVEDALSDLAAMLDRDGVQLLVLNDVPPDMDVANSIGSLLEASPQLRVWWVGGRRSRHAAITLVEVGTLGVPQPSDRGDRFEAAPAVQLLRSLAERRGLTRDAVPAMLIRRLMQRTLGHTESLTVTGLNIDRVMALSKGGFEGASLDAIGDAFFERGAVWIRRGGVDSTNQHIDAASGDAAALLEAASTFEGWLHIHDAAALAGLSEDASSQAARQLVDLGLLLQDAGQPSGTRYGLVPSVRYELRKRLSVKQRERFDARLAARLLKQAAALDEGLTGPEAHEVQQHWASYDLDVLGAVRRLAGSDLNGALGLAARTWRWFSRAGQAATLAKRLEAMLASRKASQAAYRSEAQAALGALQVRLGRLSEAVKRLEKAERDLPAGGVIWHLARMDLAWAQGRLDRPREGLAWLENLTLTAEASTAQADWLAGRKSWVEGALEERLGTPDAAWASYEDAARRFEASALADGVQLARLSQALLADLQGERAQATWATRLLLESLDARGMIDPQETTAGLVRLANALEAFEPTLTARLRACLATCPPLGLAVAPHGGDNAWLNAPVPAERTAS
jgi:DNA-binding SARP family transcriptional activator/tetratricopeptide (TPR) repeat protein